LRKDAEVTFPVAALEGNGRSCLGAQQAEPLIEKYGDRGGGNGPKARSADRFAAAGNDAIRVNGTLRGSHWNARRTNQKWNPAYRAEVARLYVALGHREG
jgi:hypothetical protein